MKKIYAVIFSIIIALFLAMVLISALTIKKYETKSDAPRIKELPRQQSIKPKKAILNKSQTKDIEVEKEPSVSGPLLF